MSKQMNECADLLGMSLYHLMTEFVFFHWFKLFDATTLELILWRIFLLMMPISDLDGLMSLHVGLLLKLGLWSFSVTNESFSANTSILLSRSRLSLCNFLFFGHYIVHTVVWGFLVGFCYVGSCYVQ